LLLGFAFGRTQAPGHGFGIAGKRRDESQAGADQFLVQHPVVHEHIGQVPVVLIQSPFVKPQSDRAPGNELPGEFRRLGTPRLDGVIRLDALGAIDAQQPHADFVDAAVSRGPRRANDERVAVHDADHLVCAFGQRRLADGMRDVAPAVTPPAGEHQNGDHRRRQPSPPRTAAEAPAPAEHERFLRRQLELKPTIKADSTPKGSCMNLR